MPYYDSDPGRARNFDNHPYILELNIGVMEKKMEAAIKGLRFWIHNWGYMSYSLNSLKGDYIGEYYRGY